MPSKNLRLGPCAAVKQFVMNHACDMNLGDAPSNELLSSVVGSYDPKAGRTSLRLKWWYTFSI